MHKKWLNSPFLHNEVYRREFGGFAEAEKVTAQVYRLGTLHSPNFSTLDRSNKYTVDEK